MSYPTTNTPPECCPVCGAGEDWRDTNDGRVSRVAYMCGAKWAQYNAHRTPLSPPEWVSDCSHAMTAALRCGATLTGPSTATQAAALVEAVNGLVEYRARVGPLNFQLEKADDFIKRMAAYLAYPGA